jgi:hypothetical protein
MGPRSRHTTASAVGVVIALCGVAGVDVLSAQEPGPLAPKDGLVCVLVNVNSGRCLSVANQAVEAGARIVQGPTPDKAGPSEQWTLVAAGQAFRLRNEHSGLVVQVWSSQRQKGVQPVQSPDEVDKPHQHITFEPKGNAYLLRVGHSQLVLGVGNSGLEDGARVIQWNEVPGVKDQYWILRSATDRSPIVAGLDATAPSTDAASPASRGWRTLLVLLGLLVMLALAFAVRAWVTARRAGPRDASR